MSSRFSSRSYTSFRIDVDELIRGLSSSERANVFFFRVGHVTQIYYHCPPQRYGHPYQLALAITVPLLISLLQLKYAERDQNPFVVHPAAMWTTLVSFLLSMLAYCCAFAAARNRINPSIPIRVRSTFGFLSVSSLTIAFLPSMFWWLIYAPWACSVAFLFTGLFHFQPLYIWVSGKVSAIFLQFSRIFRQSNLQSLSTSFSSHLRTSSSSSLQVCTCRTMSS